MNLIERLGGYEATKEKYQALSDSDMITIGPVEFSAKDYFEDELLSHRRQNNIFEVGDLYVFTEKYSKHSVIHKVDSLNSGKGCIRHATDEEIKAGRRL